MKAGALLLLTLASQAAAPPQGAQLGDPRSRGGARDLFEHEVLDEAPVRRTTTFVLRPRDISSIGPLALTNMGRYAAYVMTRTSGERKVIVVDTASATVRAVGPVLMNVPHALGLSSRRLFVAEANRLIEITWFAQENAARAFKAPAAPQATTPLSDGTTHRLLLSESSNALALLRSDHAGFQLLTRALSGGELVTTPLHGIPASAACVSSMTSSAHKATVYVLCQEGSAIIGRSVPLRDHQANAFLLNVKDPDAQLRTSACANGKVITGWQVGNEGEVVVYDDDGGIAKHVMTTSPPSAMRVLEQNVVVVDEKGGVFIMGLTQGESVIVVHETPTRDEVTRTVPVISADGRTVVSSRKTLNSASHTLSVIPALQ